MDIARIGSLFILFEFVYVAYKFFCKIVFLPMENWGCVCYNMNIKYMMWALAHF